MEDNKFNEPLELAGKIVNILDKKKARNIKLLHVTDQTIIADYFIIATGTSNTQIKSLANEIEYQLSLEGIKPRSIEGMHEALWVLLDYHSVIVHVFNRETREFFNLEKLWSDGEEVDISNFVELQEEEQ